MHDYVGFTLILINILFWLIFLVANFYEVPLRKEMKRVLNKKQLTKRSSKEPRSFDDTCELIEESLQSLNISLDTKDHKEERNYLFDYQNGHFSLTVPRNGEQNMRLLFPGIVSTELDNIDSVRIVCNDLNVHNTDVHAFYHVVGEENKIIIHLASDFPCTLSDAEFLQHFKLAAENCFLLRKAGVDYLDKLLENASQYNVPDVEYRYYQNDAIEQMIAEMELSHSTECLQKKNSAAPAVPRLDIHNLLRHLIPTGDYRITEMEIICDGHIAHLTNERLIRNYNPATPLVSLSTNDEGEETATFTHSEATLIVRYLYDADFTAQVPAQSVVLRLKAERTTPQALYYSLVWLMPYNVPGHSKGKSFVNARKHPLAGRMMLSYDLIPMSQKRAEFKYMRADAIDKYNEGKGDDCTPEQRLIYGLEGHGYIYDLYWGKRMLREKRYFEATLHLERAWNALNASFLHKDKRHQDVFYQTSHLLGLSLYELGLYKEAYYYLQQTEALYNTSYTQTLINCMTAMGDVRTLKFVQDYIAQIETYFSKRDEEEEEDKDTPQYLEKFLDFLRRREIYLDIEQGFLDEAEKQCKKMLEEDANSDFALTELAHLQEMRAEGTKKNGLQSDDGNLNLWNED